MGRSADRSPRLKPVKKIELSQKNIKLRTILVIVFFAIGLLAIGIGIHSALSEEDGWQEIEATSQKVNCSADFTLNYCLGQGKTSATAEAKALTSLYTRLVEDGYAIFQDGVAAAGSRPGETVTVDPALYRAFQQIRDSGNRCLYLAPVYVEYDRIFLCETAQEASQYDPGQNQELVEYISAVATYANDPQMIDLELLGNDQVRLKVSAEYLAFAKEYEITEFLSLGWMRNAFIADYMADALMNAGYTNGYLASFDGFTRNLDTRGESYSQNVFDRLENTAYIPAVLRYEQPTALVFLRNYPLDQQDRWHYFGFSSGRIVTTMIDPADGMSKSATDNLLSYSQTVGCAQILLETSKWYLASELDESGLNELTGQGIYSIWFESTNLRYNEKDAQILLVADGELPAYTKTYAGN